MIRYIILMSFFLVALSGCYYDSEEYLFPEINNNCDTLNVTYTKSIKPILENTCLSCHSNNVAGISGGNIQLEDYADVKAKADDGKLFEAITRNINRMPLDANRLSDCKIATIKIWINNGSPNN